MASSKRPGLHHPQSPRKDGRQTQGRKNPTIHPIVGLTKLKFLVYNADMINNTNKKEKKMKKTERIVIDNQTIIIWKNSRKVFAIVKPEGGITQDPLKVRGAQIKVDQHFRAIDYDRFMVS